MRGLSFRSLVVSILVLISITSLSAAGAPALEFHEEPTGQKYVVKSLELPSALKVGSEMVGEAIIANQGTGPGTALIELRINNMSHNLYDVYLEPGQESVLRIRHVFNKIGVYEIELKTEHDSKKHTVEYVVSLQNAGQEPTPPEETPLPGASFSLARFDINSDCKIGDGEFFDVIDNWINRVIDELLFFSAVDAWIGQSSVCAAATSLKINRVQANVGSQGVTFIAMGATPSRIAVEVYSMTGQHIFNDASTGSTLRWNLRTNDGTLVPNGVYLYRVEWQDGNGQRHFEQIKKLVVLR